MIHLEFFLFLTQALLLQGTTVAAEQKCSMYGMVNESMNLFYDGPPILLSQEGMPILEELCSNLLPPNHISGTRLKTCCALDQLTYFRTMVANAKRLVPLCLPCLENIFRLTCTLICSPSQSDFVLSQRSPSNLSLVEGAFYAVSVEFAEGFFNSCKDVKSPNSLIPVAGIFCPSGIDKCTPKEFASSILHGGLFNITLGLFKADTNLTFPMRAPMNESALACHQSHSLHKGNISYCGCVDCLLSCPPLPSVPISKWNQIYFGLFTIYQMVVLSSYGFLIVVTFIGILAFHLKRRLSRAAGEEEKDFLVNPFAGSDTENNEFHQNEDDNDKDNNHQNTANAGNSSAAATAASATTIYSTRHSRRKAMRLRMHAKLCWCLNKWGFLVASYRIAFLLIPLVLVTALSFGIMVSFQITSDPIELWSSPNSKLGLQKSLFDQSFGPFYRTEQIIMRAPKLNSSVISLPDRNITIGPALHPSVLMEAFQFHRNISNLRIGYIVDFNSTVIIKTITFDDICIKPMFPENKHCVSYSPIQYFQANLTLFTMHPILDYSWLLHLSQCSQNPLTIADPEMDMASCFSNFMAPVPPNLVFGGYDTDPLNASALILTYVVNNYPKSDPRSEYVANWEAELLNMLKSYSHPTIEIAFSTERSIEDEINRQSTTQALTVLISYLVMFAYVVLALGRIPSRHFINLLVEQKLMIGLAGVVLVLISVIASVGFFCYLKFKVTMIVLEVLPFLALAIGVDNIFLLVHAFQRKNSHLDLSQSITYVIGEVMAEVGPGMLVSAVVQVAVFSIGSISSLSAVRSFSLFAALALGINFILQITVFLALLSLDATRERSRRVDIFCCFRLAIPPEEGTRVSPLQWLFGKFSSFILHRFCRPIIILLFSLFWLFCVFHIPSIPVGLDQTIALPMDSYLHSYFRGIFTELRSGPPVYFVVTPGFKYEEIQEQARICSFGPCERNSLASTIFSHSRQANVSFLASPVDSWVDTYLAWLQPSDSGQSCCSFRTVSEPDNQSYFQFCPTSSESSFDDCEPCLVGDSSTVLRPNSSQFSMFLPWFLSDIPNIKCPLGGRPSYGANVILDPHHSCAVPSSPECLSPIVSVSRFMAYHTALSTSDDFINSMRHSVKLADELSSSVRHKVIAYSPFYIFYEYSLTIWKDTLISMGASFGAAYVSILIMFGFDLRVSYLIFFLVVAMTVSDAGIMYFLGLQLNPISLVNLVMLTGVNVEFVSHVARSFLSSGGKTREDKARDALVTTGGSVFSGIVLTKILGVSVLAFSGSWLFRLYYFRMYATAITVGALHGLVLLPVLLSYFGPLDSVLHNPAVHELNNEDDGGEALFS